MTQVFEKQKLSASIDGLSIPITATTITGGNVIHESITGTADYDEVWLWAMNMSTGVNRLDIEFGAKTSPDNIVTTTVPPQGGLMKVIPGFLVNNGKSVFASSENANVIFIYGYVHRISG